MPVTPSAPLARHRRVVRTLVAAVLALGVLAALGACSKSKEAAPATTSTTTPAPVVAFTITDVDPNATAPPDDATVAAVKATLDQWLAVAIIGPLHSGQPAGDLSAVFTPAALARAQDPTVRPGLVAEGLPPATEALTADHATAALKTVAGPDGVVALIAAQIDLKLHAAGATSDVDVIHYGEVVLVAADTGGWKIDAFDLVAAQESRP